MYRRVAVPLDGSKESEQALRWAVTIARQSGCSLELLHAMFPPLASTELAGTPLLAGPPLDELESAIRNRLRVLAAKVAALGVGVEPIVIDGTVPDGLIDHMQARGTDLVVMTTHDRNRLERLLLGSMAASIVRHTQLPVLLVRPEAVLREITSPVRVQHILVPLDGSAFADEILQHASELATVMRAELILLSVLQPVLAVATAALDTGPDPLVPLSNGANADGSARSLPELDREAESLRATRHLVVRTEVVAGGEPARAIVEYAKRHGVDLIAMTTHGRGALKRLVAGSVSEAVIRTSKLPMLIIRPQVP